MGVICLREENFNTVRIEHDSNVKQVAQLEDRLSQIEQQVGDHSQRHREAIEQQACVVEEHINDFHNEKLTRSQQHAIMLERLESLEKRHCEHADTASKNIEMLATNHQKSREVLDQLDANIKSQQLHRDRQHNSL